MTGQDGEGSDPPVTAWETGFMNFLRNVVAGFDETLGIDPPTDPEELRGWNEAKREHESSEIME